MEILLIRSLASAIPVTILSIIDLLFIIGGYGLLRALHISANWVTWSIGSFLIVASGVTSLLIFVPSQAATFNGDALLGVLSFGVAVYSASQWITRKWYVSIKKSTVPFFSRSARDILLFMRKHHQFFGWIVLATATAHGLSYIFIIQNVSQKELITGLIVWAILALLTGLGLWVEYNVKHKHLSKNARWLHVVLSVAFFVLFLTHA